jgi:peptidoglycan/LPS O-acetylase OafA/YrhL
MAKPRGVLHFSNEYAQVATIEPPRALGHTWSLAVEEQFYVVWPFIVFGLSETSLAWIAGSLLIVAPALRWIYTPYFPDFWSVYMLTPFRMDCLSAGALLAILWHNRKSWITRYGHFGLVLTSAAGITLVAISRVGGFNRTANTQRGNTILYELTLLASMGIVLWALSGRFVGVLQWAPLRYLGRISYTVYLMHIFALALAGRYLQRNTVVAEVAAVGTLIYASLSWHFLEKPLLGSKPKEASVLLTSSEGEETTH